MTTFSLNGLFKRMSSLDFFLFLQSSDCGLFLRCGNNERVTRNKTPTPLGNRMSPVTKTLYLLLDGRGNVCSGLDDIRKTRQQTNNQTKQTAGGVLTRREHSPPHSQADLSVASGGVHQVYYIFVRFPSNHIFIHRNELVAGSKPPVALSGSVLYYGANNNLFKDNQY